MTACDVLDMYMMDIRYQVLCEAWVITKIFLQYSLIGLVTLAYFRIEWSKVKLSSNWQVLKE